MPRILVAFFQTRCSILSISYLMQIAIHCKHIVSFAVVLKVLGSVVVPVVLW